METGIFEIELNDGRIFRIFYANSTQKRKTLLSIHKKVDLIKKWNVLTNGIHTHKQWEEIVKTL